MTKPLLRSSLLLAAVLGVASPAAARIAAGSKTVSVGDVSATLSWSASEYAVAEKPRLKVVRAGTQLLDTDLTKACTFCVGLADPQRAIAIRDLEGNGEPVVVVDLFSGGAHCCWASVLVRLTDTDPGYAMLAHTWGNGGYALKQLDGDGVADFRADDDRFAYRFAPYVASYRPPRIFNLRGSRLVDVTRRFPALVRKDLREIDKLLPDARKLGETRGLVAARVADMELLGLGGGVDTYLRRALARGDLDGISGYPKGRRFIAALKKFLRNTGYIR